MLVEGPSLGFDDGLDDNEGKLLDAELGSADIEGRGLG